jgi:Ca-activated chloride channel family protein
MARTRTRRRLAAALAVLATGGATLAAQQDSFRFRSSVELVNVTATVTDSRGHFVSNLRKEDFRVFEDGEEQPVTHFSNERVPVSLGIAVDTSGSMEGDKFDAARRALDRFLFDLLASEDEVFIFRFNDQPVLIHDWTRDREAVSRALRRVNPTGGTALYDAVAEAVPLAENGSHRKKALLVISDGNDRNSATDLRSVKQLIRESEVMVYAIGIDGRESSTFTQRIPIPIPFPIPGGRRRPWPLPPIGGRGGGTGGGTYGGSISRDERVNEGALRELTDDSGGRTEIIRSARDLDPATAGIAHELSQQYSLGYPTNKQKDGRWHSIDVEVRRGLTVRARRGYVAS